MSFFGLTTLGNGNFFAHNAMRKMDVHDITEEKWVEAYQSVGLSPEDAFELQVRCLPIPCPPFHRAHMGVC